MSDRFNIVKKGYDPRSVDVHIETLENELRTYKEKDALITQAIVSAQQAAEGIIINAKKQGAAMRENTAKQLADITASIKTQRQMLSEFAYEYNSIVSKYLQVVDSSDFRMINEKIDALEAFLRNFSDEVAEDLEIEKMAANKGNKDS